MEAFFNSTGHLVVAVCNRKEYTTVTVPVCQLCDENWVCNISNTRKPESASYNIPTRGRVFYKTLVVVVVVEYLCKLRPGAPCVLVVNYQ